jgi:hypothetical protein
MQSAAVDASASPLLPLKRGPANADVSRMAAAPSTGVTASELFDAVSPELVLVDSELATRVRALLPDPTTLERPALVLPSSGDAVTLPAQSNSRKPRVFPMSFPDNGSVLEAGAASEALHRLLEHALDVEVLASRVSSRGHFRRCTTLISTSSAAAATSLLVLQLYLSAGSLG